LIDIVPICIVVLPKPEDASLGSLSDHELDQQLVSAVVEVGFMRGQISQLLGGRALSPAA
jgi:hypothetical protein